MSEPKNNTFKSTQHIWPTFLAATLLAILGFVFALRSAPLELPTREISKLTLPAIPDFEAPSAALKIPLNVKSGILHVYIQQITTKNAQSTRAQFSFDIKDTKVSDTRIQRRFENVAVEIENEGRTLSPSISFDVAQLLQTTKYNVDFSDKSAPKITLISSDPGRLSRVLNFLVESIALSSPQLPKTIHPNKTWKSLIDFEGNQDFNGVIQVQNKFIGENKNTFQIQRTLSSEITQKKQNTHIKTTGTGTTILDRKNGEILRSELFVKSTSNIDTNDFVSSFTISLIRDSQK